MMRRNWTTKTFIRLTKVAFATLLVVAPWTFGFGSAATWNACLSGGAIAIAALAALAYEAEWEGVTSLGLGLWVVLSPSVIGFVQDETATLIHLLVGLAVASLATTTLLGNGRKQIHRRFG
jgi:SPW repeat